MRRDMGPVLGPETIVSAEFPGTPDGVRTALASACSSLSARGAVEEEVFSAELVIAEALNNVVEHALVAADEPVFRLRLRASPHGVLVEIRDHGRAMPEGCPPIGNAPILPADHSMLPEGGFGWFLIREIARDLTYCRAEGENILSFRLAMLQLEVA